jgi:hypothetical protein
MQYNAARHPANNTDTQEKIMSSGKSGFEIRADLLSLAEGILINNIENERSTIYMWNDNHPESKKELPLRTVEPQDVITVAKQFNEFVCNEK